MELVGLQLIDCITGGQLESPAWTQLETNLGADTASETVEAGDTAQRQFTAVPTGTNVPHETGHKTQMGTKSCRRVQMKEYSTC